MDDIFWILILVIIFYKLLKLVEDDVGERNRGVIQTDDFIVEFGDFWGDTWKTFQEASPPVHQDSVNWIIGGALNYANFYESLLNFRVNVPLFLVRFSAQRSKSRIFGAIPDQEVWFNFVWVN